MKNFFNEIIKTHNLLFDTFKRGQMEDGDFLRFVSAIVYAVSMIMASVFIFINLLYIFNAWAFIVIPITFFTVVWFKRIRSNDNKRNDA